VRHLTLGGILTLHERMLQRTGGASGVRDLGALESAVAQPRMTFGGEDLYPGPPDQGDGSRRFESPCPIRDGPDGRVIEAMETPARPGSDAHDFSSFTIRSCPVQAATA